MARYGIAGQQYFDNNGKPLNAGKLYFYNPGTTTDKTTYSDEGLTIANTQPLVLSASGRQGDVFFSGQAKVVIKTSADVSIDTTDPVGDATTEDAFALYSATASYDEGDIVKLATGEYYSSIVNSNSGNAPASSPTAWAEVRLIGVYNANKTYDSGEIVISSDLLYTSLQGANTGNTPASTPAFWKPIIGDLWTDTTPKTASFTAVVGRRYLVDTSGASLTMTLPASPSVGDVIGFTDYGQTFDTNVLIVARNGNEIMNLSEDMNANLKNYSGSLEYTTDRGWILA